jgi:hypothetical protein
VAKVNGRNESWPIVIAVTETGSSRLDFFILRCQFCPFYKGLQDFSRRRIQSEEKSGVSGQS